MTFVQMLVAKWQKYVIAQSNNFIETKTKFISIIKLIFCERAVQDCAKLGVIVKYDHFGERTCKLMGFMHFNRNEFKSFDFMLLFHTCKHKQFRSVCLKIDDQKAI